ncbi:hypothetical protein HOY82DRAFT_619554 [Tuber indicum]|nr:hypothetical protein HOY82DRAFT_619554 [Tuber indicum]
MSNRPSGSRRLLDSLFKEDQINDVVQDTRCEEYLRTIMMRLGKARLDHFMQGMGYQPSLSFPLAGTTENSRSVMEDDSGLVMSPEISGAELNESAHVLSLESIPNVTGTSSAVNTAADNDESYYSRPRRGDPPCNTSSDQANILDPSQRISHSTMSESDLSSISDQELESLEPAGYQQLLQTSTEQESPEAGTTNSAILNRSESRRATTETCDVTDSTEQSEYRKILLRNHDQGLYFHIEEILCHYTPSDNATLAALVLKNEVEADRLFHSVQDPGNIIAVAALLSRLSERGTQSDILLAELVLQSPDDGTMADLTLTERIEQMLQVSARAYSFICSNQLSAEELRLKLMLSYIMLHVTMEEAIVPMIRTQQPNATARTIEGAKLAVFRNQLNTRNGIVLELGTLKDQVHYGKILWTMASYMGIVILPILAVAGPGITILSRTHGLRSKHIEVVASRLSMSTLWNAICQSWSQIVVELIFTRSRRHYSRTELFCHLLRQPILAADRRNISAEYLQPAYGSIRLNEICSQPPPASLSIREAKEIMDSIQVKLPIFPQNIYPTRGKHQVQLVDWVLMQPETKRIQLEYDPTLNRPNQVSILLAAFTSLLEPGLIADELVGFLSQCWCQQGLPGWAMLAPSYTNKLLNASLGDSVSDILTTALGGRRLNIAYENVVIPIEAGDRIFPLVVSLSKSSATLYLTLDQDSGDGVVERLMEILKQKPIFTEWSIKVQPLGRQGGSDDSGRNKSVLRYLQFSYRAVTGSRFFTQGTHEQYVMDYRAIVVACLWEAYNLAGRNEGDEQLDPDSCRFDFM